MSVNNVVPVDPPPLLVYIYDSSVSISVSTVTKTLPNGYEMYSFVALTSFEKRDCSSASSVPTGGSTDGL